MKKLVLPAILFSIAFVACKQDNKTLLSKKWQAISLDNPQLQQSIKEQEAFIDTFGKNSTAEQNATTYGTSNVDSMRESMRQQLNDVKSMQEHAVKTTWFDFRKDGAVVMNFSGQVDSTNWYFDDDSTLVLDELKLKGTGNKIVMKVNELSNDKLRLTFQEDGFVGTITFEPGK